MAQFLNDFTTFPKERWIRMYTSVYNYCTARPPGGRAGGRVKGATFVGEELYFQLVEFLKRHMKSLLREAEQRVEQSLLEFYDNEWQRYSVAMRYLNHIFHYLNRHWVQRETEDGKQNVYEIYRLALVIWRDHFFSALKSRITRAILQLFAKERNGEQIDSALITVAVASYRSLGFNREHPKEESLQIYKEYFADDFVTDTEVYYIAESTQFVGTNSVSYYMVKVLARLDEEDKRSRLYLHSSTAAEVKRTLERVFIENQLDALRAEFPAILENDRTDDMARLFELLRRVNGFSCLRDTFELYVQAVGVAALQAVAKQAVNDPKLYVETILHVLNKYRDMVNGSLQGDPGFLEALQKGCRKFINENAVCAEALTPTKSPELLARYTDAILRKSARTPPENELERLLDDIMEIFTYVEDKDVFQTFYGKALAKRLIHGTSASEDLEGTMIGKLKGACGFEFTSKLQRMFGDVSVSKDKAEIFRKGDGKAVSFDFTPLVLATGAWPLQSPTTDFLAPADLHACAALFSTFYEREFAGRRLKWLHQLSKGELRGAGYASSKVGYVFQASLYQMGVLLLFNEHKQLSLADIQASTRLADAVLVNTIKVRCGFNAVILCNRCS
eukprot:TRINITY_DN1756_c0_g1_i3.p1 TRINITY_DN1756_c0_g1~~TRINITY_DN1756_c0_g1_i3.p1  ORF type:complete len:683 (+),score=179.25 TRINITY_DN1756_c0_g1_i3:196-2049(+)